MKPVLEHLPLEAEESFVCKYFDYEYYPTPWHFHPEYELVLVTESTGKRFIGDNISNFEPGDLVFMGPNLPHLYRNNPEYYEAGSDLRAKSIVVHFLESSFGENFLVLPETRKIKNLFERSSGGLNISGKTNKTVSEKLIRLLELKGLSRWLHLLEILDIMACSEEYSFISGSAMRGLNEKESDRLNKVFEFVMNNFSREIRVNEVAGIVNMAENSFSRYFSQRTRKTFSSFVTEVRLGHACKLLTGTQKSVTEICFECGFNNLSNFNRYFKQEYQLSPLNYRKRF